MVIRTTLTTLICLFFFATAVPGTAQAEGKGVFGLGVAVGEPLGVAAKYYLSDDTAIAGVVGYGFVAPGFHAHADFLWHPWVIEREESFALLFYAGPGVRFLIRESTRFRETHLRVGARGVLGLQFDFTKVPVDAFVEVAPIFDLRTRGDAIGFALNASAGARYYF